MNSQTFGIITLLRSALKGESLTLPEDFDWNSAQKIFFEHHMVGLAIRGAVRCGVPRSHPAFQNLTALFCKDVATSKLQIQQLNIIYSLFEEHGIEYLPLKGAILKNLYPQPELRMMGDADILIRQEQYPMIRSLLESLGLQEKSESSHEFVWHGNGFKLELHKCLIPPYNKDYYTYYGDGWKLARKNGEGSSYHLSTEDHFIYLLVHFAKHYRNGSISAKNICDFWVYRNAYPDMDEAYINAQLQKLQLSDFYQNILDLLRTWFDGATPTNAVVLISQAAFQGGIYDPDECKLTVSVIKLTKETTTLSGSKRRWLVQRIFPPVLSMATQYPILKKHPVMLPFLWVVRWFEIVFCNPKRLKRNLATYQEVMHMDDHRISDYENQLRSIGLGFNFPE